MPHERGDPRRLESSRRAGKPGRDGRRSDRRAEPRSQRRGEPVAHVSDDIVKELMSTARPGKGEILVKVFAEAVTAYLEDDLDTAIGLGEQAKHLALRAVAPRELLGLAYYRAEKWSEAARELAAFRRISGSAAQNPVLADCYRAMGRPEKALELCDEMDPGGVEEAAYFEGAIVAAAILADLGRLDEAIARLEGLALRSRSPKEHHLRAWYVLGDLLERKGRFTQARSWFDAVAGVDADVTDAPARASRLARKASPGAAS